MRVLALTALLIASCASQGTEFVPRLADVEQATRKIDRDEQQCVEQVGMWSEDLITGVVPTLGALTQLQIQTVLARRAHALSQCQAQADHEKELLAASERTNYQKDAEKQQSINTLMPILTTSRGLH